jgi:fibronectin type 3 domain-containing protein
MKKSILLLWATALVLFNGCGAVKGLMIYDSDATLKSINVVKTLPRLNSVGFEWDKITDMRVHGFNVYRGTVNTGKYELKHIGTVDNPHATHFVDIHVKPNTQYIYTFTTFYLGKESQNGTEIKVKTLSSIAGVTFLEAYKVSSGVTKLLWRPHSNPSINAYIIQRSVNNSEWKYVSQVQGQLMVEYIDTFVHRGSTYRYRIIAKHYDGILTKPSPVASLAL